jgi:hypothetical protein
MAFGADSPEEFLERLEELLQKLASRGVVLKPSKCVFGASGLEYLGHSVSADGVKLTDTRVRAVLDMPAPKSETALRRFLGMANSFRAHIPNYSTLVRPLTALLGKNKAYEWSSSCVQAFEKMRKAIADHAQLMWIDYSLPLVLRTDASKEGVGAVLLQVKDGVEHPVVFLSETLSDVATRWSTLEQEAYAIYWAVMKLEGYLLGQFFYLQTDHRNLVYISEATAPKVVRWRLRLQEYHFQIVHIPGVHNEVADALSRVNCAAFGSEYGLRVDSSLAGDGSGAAAGSSSNRSGLAGSNIGSRSDGHQRC